MKNGVSYWEKEMNARVAMCSSGCTASEVRARVVLTSIVLVG